MIVKGWTSECELPQRVYAGGHDFPDGRIAFVTARIHGWDHGFKLNDWLPKRLPALLVETGSVGELWSAVNAAISPDLNSGNFVTSTVAIHDPNRGELEWACFSSPEAFLVRNGGVPVHTPKPIAPAFGLIDDIDDTQWKPEPPVPVHSGDTLILHDGITDLWNPDRIDYGAERLEEVVVRSAGATPDPWEIAKAVWSDCDEHCAHDWTDWPAALLVAVI